MHARRRQQQGGHVDACVCAVSDRAAAPAGKCFMRASRVLLRRSQLWPFQVMAAVTADKLYDAPLVTELVPLEKYWPGEDYHQVGCSCLPP